MKKQVVIGPGGERYVQLLEADYEALVRAAQAAGIEIEEIAPTARPLHLPPHQQARITAGENPIRVWREFRGLTTRELADRVKLLDEDLAELETGQREPTTEVLKALAKALRVPMEALA